MQSTIAISGATGFVGRHVVRELLSSGRSVRALVRDAAHAQRVLPRSSDISYVVGDILDRNACADLVAPASGCIHLVGIIRELPGSTFRKAHVDATRAIVDACEARKVKRYLHMSALGARDTARTDYQRTKWEGESIVRESALDWTIFRPGMIHGVGSEFLEMVKGFASGLEPPYFFLPYFTRGTPEHRVPLGGETPVDPVVAPIDVRDVARAFVAAIDAPQSIGETYNLVGPETLSWPKLLTLVRDHAGGNHNLRPFGVPAKLASMGAVAAKKLGLGLMLPFDAGMPIMASEDSIADPIKARKHLNLEFRPFTPSFVEYAPQLAGH